MKCVMCEKNVKELVKSKIMWEEHEGFVTLTIAKDPETLHVGHPGEVCQPCSIKALSGMLRIELEEISDLFNGLVE